MDTTDNWRGHIADVKTFPFVLRNWERRRVLRYWPIMHFDGSSIVVNENGAVTEWKDLSGNANNAVAKVLMPRWFHAWLWCRTQVAHLKGWLYD